MRLGTPARYVCRCVEPGAILHHGHGLMPNNGKLELQNARPHARPLKPAPANLDLAKERSHSCTQTREDYEQRDDSTSNDGWLMKTKQPLFETSCVGKGRGVR